jgi:hypothetical protein
MCLLRYLFFLFVGLVTLVPPAKATTFPEVPPPPSLAAQIDVQCKTIMGNRICRDVGASKKQKSGAKKSGAKKKEANKKGSGETAKKQNGKSSVSDRAEVDFGPVEQTPTQQLPNNDNVLWGDYTHVPNGQQ